MLRDWTTSEKVDKISVGAEVFFVRLIMKADDYGSFHANPKLLRAALFPLRDYTDKQIKVWLTECRDAVLIELYKAENREYLRIIDFGQRLRTMRGNFPQPADNLRTNVSNLPPELEEEEEEKKKKEVEEEGATAQVCVWPTFDDFWSAYGYRTGRKQAEAKFKKIIQEEREKIMLHVVDYVKSTPDIKYRKHPATYLNNESWNDEIIIHNGNGKEFNPAESAKRIDEILKARSNT